MMIKLSVILTGFLVGPGLVTVQSPESIPLAQTAAQRGLDRVIADQKIKDLYRFRRDETIEELDDDNAVKKTEITTAVKSGWDHEIAGEKVNLFRTLSEKHQFFWVSLLQQPFDGRSVMIIGFRPKPDELSRKTRVDHFLNRLEGKLYIVPDSFEILRAEASIPQEFDFWTILSKWLPIPLRVNVYQVEFEIEMQQVNGFWTEKTIIGTGRMTFFHRRYTYTYRNFERK